MRGYGNKKRMLTKFIKTPCSTHEKSQYWSPKNLLLPSQVSVWSREKVLWNCPTCLHEFSATPAKIFGQNHWCSFCNIGKLCDDDNCDFCERKSFRSHPKSIYWSTLNTISPRQVSLHSSKYCWFDCPNCLHSFEYCINWIVDECWCPYCNGRSLCGIRECITCTPKSFGSHPMSLQWDESNEISPYCVALQCNKKFWFKCIICNHKFYSNLGTIVRECTGCPYCNYCKLCDSDDCMMCFNRSFASSPFCFMWSIKNNITPRQVCIKSSVKKRWFYCSICKHDFAKTLNEISSDASGICPYCSIRCNILCDSDDCAICFNKSFMSCEQSKHWSPRNGFSPRTVFKGSDKKYWFICNICGDEFNIRLANVTGLNRWCTCVSNKTERKLYDKLKHIFCENNIIRQFNRDWCKKTNKLLFDFCITSLNIIIELDGLQHFKKVWTWGNPEDAYKKDTFKEQCAMENGYSVIRLLQDDVWNDKYDYMTELLQNIEKIKTEKTVQLILMCKNNEYKTFRDSMIQKLQEHPQVELLDEDN